MLLAVYALYLIKYKKKFEEFYTAKQNRDEKNRRLEYETKRNDAEGYRQGSCNKDLQERNIQDKVLEVNVYITKN